ncbi:mitochondrial inner membrane protease ATP23 homolog [Leptinotarsa decemlineata]|uniref:mitochondrial inner membrane protease ATP23 homolog n=1 Tax=Leptinotarsa decemlineata TaxID=7539 RepID=UPI000C251C17|nr:mitochondrial inner membrane protease ATP23 homolog [Leptinotarsa decemlineata]
MTFINPKEKEPSHNQENENSNQNDNQQHNSTEEDLSQWGYDLYPDRRKPPKPVSLGISDYLTGKGTENIDKIKCERNVYKCVKESPLVKLMMGALRASGCAIDIRRHISCEECAPTVSGGYDPILNQVVICQNTARKEGIVQAVLTHELIHMFDYCRNNLDFKNLDHLACTEIRAANLAHCSFLSAWSSGDASPLNIKEAHQICVKNKALSSVVTSRNVTQREAMEAIERVFPKCYSDLEPIGRRLRRNSHDMYRAFEDGFYYGYDNP